MKKLFTVIMLAVLAISAFCIVPSFVNADSGVEQTWVRMRGMINQWGSDAVIGWLWAHARMSTVNDTYREWAGVHAIWSYSQRNINCTDPPTDNFTYTFYAARLVNSSVIELDYSGYAFYIAGLWNVDKVTFAYYVDENGTLITSECTVESIVENGQGELRVLSNWSQFELEIAGTDLIQGVVLGHMIGHMEIKICDVNGDGQVRIQDLVHVAKRYGAMPALGNYEHELDFDFNYKIDIGDLASVAANIDP